MIALTRVNEAKDVRVDRSKRKAAAQSKNAGSEIFVKFLHKIF